MPNNTTNNSTRFGMLFIPFLALVSIHIYMAFPLEVPVVVEDEFVYLSKAGYITGALEMPNYLKGGASSGFGYPLMIAPAFLIFDEPTSIYKACVIINGIIASTLFIWLFLLIRNVLEAGRWKAVAVSFVVSLYPAYMLQSNMAWTDAVSPALFVLVLLLFYYMIAKPGWIRSFLFSFFTVFMFAVHPRGIVLVFVTIGLMAYLAVKMVFPAKLSLFSVLLIITLTIVTLIAGDFLSSEMSDSSVGLVMLDEIYNRADLVLLIIIFFTGLFFFRTKVFYILFYISIGIALAALFQLSLAGRMAGMAVLAFATGLLFLMNFLKKLSGKEVLVYLVLMAVCLVLSLIFLPQLGYLDSIVNSYYLWIVNASGRLFYLSFSTFGIYVFGFISLIAILWTRHSLVWNNIISDKKSLTLLYLLVCSSGLLFIITNVGIPQSAISPDRIFYGRSAELFMAPLLAIGILLQSDKDFEFRSLSNIFSFVFIIAFTILPLITYGNIISAEPVFRNFLMFFPLRAFLGEINIMAYLGITLFFFIIAVIMFYRMPRATIILAGIFFAALSVFIYRYVINYHHTERRDRNIIPSLIAADGKADTIYCSNKLRRNHNIYRYQFLLPEQKFVFVENELLYKKDLFIAEDSYVPKMQAHPRLITLEHCGSTSLWAGDKNVFERFEAISPSYVNVPLGAPELAGIQRGGITGTRINKYAFFNVPVRKQDVLTALKITLRQKLRQKRYFRIDLNGITIFADTIADRTKTIITGIDSLEKSDYALLQIFEDAKSDNISGEDKSPELREITIQGDARPISEAVKFLGHNPYEIRIRGNYNLISYRMKADEKAILPMAAIFGHGITNPGSGQVLVKSRWRNFAFRSIIKTGNLVEIDKEMAPGKYFFDYKIQAPSQPGKYFLEFDLCDENGEWFDKASAHTRSIIFFIE